MFHVRGRPPAAGQVDGGGGVCACQRDGTVTLHQKKRTSEILPKKVGVGGNYKRHKRSFSNANMTPKNGARVNHIFSKMVLGPPQPPF